MSRTHLNVIGVLILIVGLSCVALIERNARIQDANAIEDSEATHALLHPEDYASYARSAETPVCQHAHRFGTLTTDGTQYEVQPERRLNVESVTK